MQFKYGRLFVRADIDLSAKHDFFVLNGFFSIDIFVSPSLHTILNCTPLFLSHVISNEIFRWFALSEVMNHSVHLSLKINFRILVRVEIRAISNTFKKKIEIIRKKILIKFEMLLLVGVSECMQWSKIFETYDEPLKSFFNAVSHWQQIIWFSFSIDREGQHWKVSHWQFFSFYVPLSLPHRINVDKYWQ